MKVGTVTISTYATNNSICLSVTDEGTGIDNSIEENLFTAFATTKEYGVGLGLPICYKIAQRHNATIAYTTSSNGTTFTVVFEINSQ